MVLVPVCVTSTSVYSVSISCHAFRVWRGVLLVRPCGSMVDCARPLLALALVLSCLGRQAGPTQSAMCTRVCNTSQSV
jgi:hypothetical protein